MISKSKDLPGWLEKFAEGSRPKSNISEGKIPYKTAEQMGFFTSAKYLGRDTFEVQADIGEFFDSGSIWYIEKDEQGNDFLMKQMDETGNVIRRMSNLRKKAENLTCEENRKPVRAFLDHVASNLDEYDLYKVKQEINDIEDRVVSEDPLFQKGSSYEIVNKINKIRENVNIKIAEMIEEYEEAQAEETQEKEPEDNLEELREKELAAVSSIPLKKTQKIVTAEKKQEKKALLVSSVIYKIKSQDGSTNVDVFEVTDGDKDTRYPFSATIYVNSKYKHQKKFQEREEAIAFADDYIEKVDRQNMQKESRLKKKAQELKITEEVFDDADAAQAKLVDYRAKPEGTSDPQEYEVKQDVEGGTGKFKIYKKTASYIIHSGRVHQGKLVRVLQKEALGDTGVIKCTTPECMNNYDGKCGRRNITIEDGYCVNYEKNMKEAEAFSKMILSAREEEAEMEKQIPIEGIEEAEDIEIGDDEIMKGEEDSEEIMDMESKMSDIKSQVWEQAGNEAIDEFLDIDEATSAMYNKIVAQLELKLGNDEISEEEYNSLVDELEELKDDDILKEYLQEELLSASEGEKVNKEKKKVMEREEE